MATSAGELIYTVGMDTKGLVGGAQQVESTLTKVVDSSKKVDTAQTKASQAVSRFIEALKLEAATVGMSAQQKELYVAVLNGATTAQQNEIRTIQSAISKENEALAIKNKLIAARVEAEAKAKASQAATLRYIDALKTEAAMVNMSAKERELYIASLNGATSAQLKQISAIRDAITAEKSIASSRADSKARLDAQIESLRLEATTAAMSAQQKEMYVATLNGATAAQQREIALLRDKITASRQAAAAQANGITALRGYSNVLNNAAGSNNRFRGGIQQAGYQIQDLVVQLQMGTSAFVAFGQQGSQLAGAFGPAGAVVGAFIALISVIGQVAYASKNATADLTELANAGQRLAGLNLDTLVKVNDVSREFTSSDRISKYKALSNEVINLSQQYENQGLVTKRLRDELQAASDNMKDIGGFFGDTQAEATAKLQEKQALYNESLRAEAEIRSKVNGIQKQQQDLYDEEEKIKSDAESKTKKASKESESAAKKDLTLREQNNSAINNARLKTQQLSVELSNLKNGTEEITGATSRYSVESATLAAQQQLNKDATKQQVAALAEQILAQQRVNEAIAQGKKEQENRKKVTTEFETVEKTTLTAGESVDAKYQADLKALKDYHKLAGAENSRYEKAKARLERQYEKDKRQAMEDDYKAQSEGHAFVMDSLDALGNASTNVISGLLSGTMSVTEAMQNFANIILNQAVGALVEMGIEQVKNQMLSTALAQTQQANIATTTTASIAAGQANAAAQSAAAGSVAAASAPAAAATATWSFGQAALIGGVALAGTFALAKMLGGRQFGGPTDAGMYRVGENNQPEIYQSGGASYLISGDRGRVTPMSEIGSGGGFQQTVNVHNNSGANVSTRTSPDGKQMDIIINEIASQVEQRRGRFARAMTSGTNTKFKAR